MRWLFIVLSVCSERQDSLVLTGQHGIDWGKCYSVSVVVQCLHVAVFRALVLNVAFVPIQHECDCLLVKLWALAFIDLL